MVEEEGWRERERERERECGVERMRISVVPQPIEKETKNRKHELDRLH